MKFGLVNGEKVEATKSARALCCGCSAELIAKCGDTRIHHWAHAGRRHCDQWWENETDWHRSWKNNFPKEWQEVIHTDELSGGKHIADVKTSSDWVLEFQHSHIDTGERLSRNAFYPKLVWIVDGTRRQRDKRSFYRILDEYGIGSLDARFKHVLGPEACALMKEWHEANALVFFDFQDVNNEQQAMLWFQFPKLAADAAYLWPISKDRFIELHRNNRFDQLVATVISPFVKRLIQEERDKIAMEEFRKREISARMNWLTFGRRRF